MCSSPIVIPNPYKKGCRGFTHNSVHIPFFGKEDFLHDTLNSYISVPCGQCSQCLSMRQGFFSQRVQMESLRSEIFFFTLTYANRGLTYTDIGNYKIAYPVYSDVQNLFKRLRKVLPHSIRMFVVSEYGDKKHRPHFHGFICVSRDDIKSFYRGSHLYCEKVLFKEVFANWKRNLSKSHKHPVYMALSDFVVRGKRSTFDLHWVQPIVDHENDVSFYVTKYLFKYNEHIQKLLTKIKLDSTLSDVETKRLISLIKPRAYASKDLGSYKLPEVSSYIEKCFSRCSEYPTYYDLFTGKSMLMSPYYRKHLQKFSYSLNRWFDYASDFLLRYDSYPDSYNPELLVDKIIHDLNCDALRSIKKDRHLRKVKNLLNKK